MPPHQGGSKFTFITILPVKSKPDLNCSTGTLVIKQLIQSYISPVRLRDSLYYLTECLLCLPCHFLFSPYSCSTTLGGISYFFVCLFVLCFIFKFRKIYGISIWYLSQMFFVPVQLCLMTHGHKISKQRSEQIKCPPHKEHRKFLILKFCLEVCFSFQPLQLKQLGLIILFWCFSQRDAIRIG